MTSVFDAGPQYGRSDRPVPNHHYEEEAAEEAEDEDEDEDEEATDPTSLRQKLDTDLGQDR